jgi:hypothetical protein
MLNNNVGIVNIILLKVTIKYFFIHFLIIEKAIYCKAMINGIFNVENCIECISGMYYIWQISVS